MMEAVSTRHLPLLTLWTIVVTFFAVSAQGDCPSSLGTPRKEVVCYFEGKRPVSSLDPCFCTHVIYTNIGLDEYSRVEVTQGVKTDLSSFKEANPKLSLILSLGGSAIKSGVFSSLVNSDARFDNLTKSVGELYQDEIINGVEIDWEWPLQTGDKKDKDKLVQYAKRLKIAVENEVVVTPRSVRNRRSAQEDHEEDEEEEEVASPTSTVADQDFDG
eukprot:TCALIF_01355-PA protein Name:"Similar to Cht2 Probable chitinase 2 (Drosophila melanogaster)" AED:0.02 eAED:0.02 QI:312/1/0.6/1/0.25/0.4/5/0/215